ncbi:RNA polymerase III transcription factor IIIC subunit-domain-containing protein [Gongronella butleri]|nr:RNA polymerase III transcription factor IIIC subunit-domain-containing protein [Gongronella butleri]
MEPHVEPHPQLPVGNRLFFCVEYPGIVKNVDRAIDTLGGYKAIIQAYQGKDHHRMEMKYRPNDPFCHTINGNVLPSSRLLLKVTRRRRKDQPEEDAQITTEILGIVPYTCRFRSMADFQYVVPATDPIKQLTHDLRDVNVEGIKQFQERISTELPENQQNLPPPAFVMMETPSTYDYKQNAPIVRVRVLQPDGSYKMKLVNKNQVKASLLTSIVFEATNVPEASLKHLPTPQGAVIEVNARLREAFEDRPIWSKAALRGYLGPKDSKLLDECLPYFAYCFQNGPWRECWVRYGLDPRKSKEYGIYQQMDFRSNLKTNNTYVRARRVKRQYGQIGDAPPNESTKTEKSRNCPEAIAYVFDGVRMPSGSAWFQMCDITDPDLLPAIRNQAYLHDGPPTKRCGFYYPSAFEAVRNCLRTKFQQLAEQGYADRIYNLANAELDARVRADMAAMEQKKERDGKRDAADVAAAAASIAGTAEASGSAAAAASSSFPSTAELQQAMQTPLDIQAMQDYSDIDMEGSDFDELEYTSDEADSGDEAREL